MRKIIASEWITLDGIFDSDPNYFSEWFLPFDSVSRQEWIRNEIESADTLLLGGKTYQMLAPFWNAQTNDEMGPATKLNSMPKVVVSSTLKDPIWQNTDKIIVRNVETAIGDLKNAKGGDILVSGSGMLVSSLMQAGLIDEIHLLIHPIIYGKGKRFFTNEMPVTNLKRIETKDIDKGVIAITHKVPK